MISMPWFPGAGVLAKLLSTNSIAKPNGDGKAGGVRAFGWVEYESQLIRLFCGGSGDFLMEYDGILLF